MVFQESCAQPEVTILQLGGALSSCRKTQRYILCVSLEEELGLCFIAALLFDCFSFVSASPHFPISNCLNLPFGTQGRSRRLKPLSYRQEMGDTERLF